MCPHPLIVIDACIGYVQKYVEYQGLAVRMSAVCHEPLYAYVVSDALIGKEIIWKQY